MTVLGIFSHALTPGAIEKSEFSGIIYSVAAVQIIAACMLVNVPTSADMLALLSTHARQVLK